MFLGHIPRFKKAQRLTHRAPELLVVDSTIPIHINNPQHHLPLVARHCQTKLVESLRHLATGKKSVTVLVEVVEFFAHARVIPVYVMSKEQILVKQMWDTLKMPQELSIKGACMV